MVEAYKMQDRLVSNSGEAKRHAWQGPGHSKRLLCLATKFGNNRDTLIEQSSTV